MINWLHITFIMLLVSMAIGIVKADTRYEAESAALAGGYAVEGNASASGGKVVQGGGTITITIGDQAGKYDLTTRYGDEDDGVDNYALVLNGVVIDQWQANAGQTWLDLYEHETYGVNLKPGDILVVQGTRTANSKARVDYVDTDSISEPPPPPPPTEQFKGKVTASWTQEYKNTEGNDIDVKYYNIYRDGEYIARADDDDSGAISKQFLFPDDLQADNGTNFCLSISAVAIASDQSEVESDKTDKVCVILENPVEPPQPPPLVPTSLELKIEPLANPI